MSMIDISSLHESGRCSVFVELDSAPGLAAGVVVLTAENILDASEWYEFGPFGLLEIEGQFRLLTKISLPTGKNWYLEAETTSGIDLQRFIRT